MTTRQSSSQAPMTAERKPVLQSLTGLRFFAALAVAVSHFTANGLLPVPYSIFSFLDGGRPAVALFFVLSGFVLAYNYSGRLNNSNRRSYFIARFARIYPVHLLGIGISLITVAFLYVIHNQGIITDWFHIKSHYPVWLSISLICQLLVITAWLPSARLNQPWNSPAWSISCEAFFYCLFPLLLSLIVPLRKHTLWCIAVLGWLLQGAWLFFLERHNIGDRATFIISQFPITHLYEFILGICAATWYQMQLQNRVLLKYGAAICWTALAVLALLGIWNLKPAYYLCSPVFAVLIVTLAASKKTLPILSQRIVVLLGEASYSLYLIHIPFLHLLLLAHFNRITGIFGLCAVIGLSIVSFYLYEEPMRKKIRSLYSSSVSHRTS